ncbi:MAG: AI-2E family transporter [Bacteroidales bacterium]|nr:AI-2E family transporter [Bacteroidales bacterium]
MVARPSLTNVQRLIILGVTLLVAGFSIWFFSSIVVYIIVAFVISMIGEPLVNLLQKIHLGKRPLPRGLCSLITVLLFWGLAFTFFYIFLPLVVNEIKYFSNLDLNSLIANLEAPIGKLRDFLAGFNLVPVDFDLLAWTRNTVVTAIGQVEFSGFVSNVAGILGDAFIAILAISFISYYFMRESDLFADALVLFFPEDKEQNVRNAIHSISILLKRYFIGVLLQITGIIILNTAGLSIVGLQFNHAVTIALISGVLNVIPYVGPFLGTLIGMLVGVAVSMPMDVATEMIPLLIYIFIAMEITQLIDNVVFQPQIFSRSVKSHPLEIFIVILLAATIGGVVGMLIAIPAYTVIRVIAKEFFNQNKLVQKITEGL